jgi:hypothetical protein
VKRSFWIRLAAVGFLTLFVGTDVQSAPGPLIPTYCTQCRPCTRDLDCGYSGGTLQGFCVPTRFPCTGSSANSCVCR